MCGLQLTDRVLRQLARRRSRALVAGNGIAVDSTQVRQSLVNAEPQPQSKHEELSQSKVAVPEALAEMRLDQALARLIPELSRRSARVALEIGCVFVNGKRVKVASRAVRAGQILEVHLGGAFERATKKTGRAAREKDDATLPAHEVLYVDEHLVVVNKPSRLLTAPTPESDRGNLQHVLQQQYGREVYVVHRLDLQTSGLLVFAFSDLANRELSETFRLHNLVRRYSAFALGRYPVAKETLAAPLRGQSATTHIEVVEQFPKFCWLRAKLETGRTHQIRLHLSGRGHPVLSDPKYGSRQSLRAPRLALHAEELSFKHPTSSKLLEFQQQLPPELLTFLDEQRRLRDSREAESQGVE